MLSDLRRVPRLAVLALGCAAITGCHHKTKVAPPPPLPPPAPVALVPAPESVTPPQVQSVPEPPIPAMPAPQKVKRKKKKPAVVVAPAATAPVEVASNTPPAPVNVVGALSAGGDAASGEKEKAVESINEVEKRLTGLPASTLEAEKEGVVRVRNFLRQAHDALKSGDADGALTLATKAKVLLDDLAK